MVYCMHVPHLWSLWVHQNLSQTVLVISLEYFFAYVSALNNWVQPVVHSYGLCFEWIFVWIYTCMTDVCWLEKEHNDYFRFFRYIFGSIFSEAVPKTTTLLRKIWENINSLLEIYIQLIGLNADWSIQARTV